MVTVGSGVRYLAGGTIFGLGWALTGACPGPLIALVGFVERVVSAAPTPGIEAVLIDTGDEPLQARFTARVILGCGQRWAEERATVEKPLASVLRKISKHAGSRPFIISRRARALQILLHRGVADGAIQRGLEQASISLSIQDIRDITALSDVCARSRQEL